MGMGMAAMSDEEGSSRSREQGRSGRGAAMWALGLGGLVPFVGLTGLLLLPDVAVLPRPTLVAALAGYAAAILSFLGGIRWGTWLLTPRSGPAVVILSIVPSLAAWLLLLLSHRAAFALFAAAFLLQGAWDVAASRKGLLPPDFGRLRIVLTAVAALCMAAAAFAARA